MAQKTAPYIFPSSDKRTFGIALAGRFKQMLLEGNPEAGMPGLSTAPVFTNRNGGGGGRDGNLDTKADVVFAHDTSGVPHVRVLGINQREERMEWGDAQWLYPMVAAIDCYANMFMPGSDTPGITAQSVDGILGGYVMDLVSHYETMTFWGFTWPKVMTEAPPGIMSKDGLAPFEFHFPITVNFEAYMVRV